MKAPMLESILVAVAVVLPVAAGDRATYSLPGGPPGCVLVGPLDIGADQRPWAWIVGGRPPQWAIRVPVVDLVPGCGDGTRQAKG